MSTRREGDALRSLQRLMAQTLRPWDAFPFAADPQAWDVRTELDSGEPPERPYALIEQVGDATTDGAPRSQQVTMPVTASLYLPRAESRSAATDRAHEIREVVWQAVKVGPNLRRPTTDRLPLWSFQPRVEVHRVRATARTGTFTVTVAGVTTDPIAADTTADVVAGAVGDALAAAEVIDDAGDVVGQDRGRGLWDLAYTAASAGRRIGDPTIDGDDLQGPNVSCAAWALLHGTPAPWRGPSDFMRVSSFTQRTVRDPADPTLVMVPVDLRLTFVRGVPLPLDLRIMQRLARDL